MSENDEVEIAPPKTSQEPSAGGNLKDRLNQMKLKRQESASKSLQFDPSSSSISASGNGKQIPSTAEERKRILQRMRESRSQVDSNRKSKVDEEGEGDEEDESITTSQDEKNKINQDTTDLKEISDEDITELFGVEIPQLEFDMTFTRTHFKDPKENPILLFPKQRPHPSELADQCLFNILRCCYCRSCCGENPSWALKSEELNKLYINEYENVVDQQEQRRSHEIDREHLYNSTQSPLQSSNDQETSPLINPKEIAIDGSGFDGLFVNDLPILTSILLDGEQVNPQISSYAHTGLKLSRITQRILREIKSVTQDLEKDRQLLKDSNGGVPPNDDHEWLQPYLHKLKSLRKYLSNTHSDSPSLKLDSNILNENFSRIIFPYPSKPFGGEIGFWSKDTNLIQRYGPLPGSFQHHLTRGTLFKCFLHHIVLAEHPLMNAEERHSAYLKELFSQYCSMFQQKTLEFMAQRIQTLCLQMSECLSGPSFDPNYQFTDEEFQEFQLCYQDLVYFLPSLSELTRHTHAITSNLYNAWKDMKEIRRRQTFNTTPLSIKIKRMRSNYGTPPPVVSSRMRRRVDDAINNNTSPRSNDGKTPRDQQPDIDSTVWQNFCANISLLSKQLPKVHDLLQKRNEATNPKPQDIPSSEDTPTLQTNSSNQPQTPSQSNQTPNLTSPHASIHQPQIKTNEDYNKESKLLLKSIQELTALPGIIPAFAIQLSENGAVTPDSQLPIIELKRRQLLKSIKYRLAIKINGNIVKILHNRSISFPSFVIDLRNYFEAKVLTMPTEVSIDIYAKQQTVFESFKDQYLSTILLPIPGSRTHASLIQRNHHHSRGNSSSNNSSSSFEIHYTHNITSMYGGFYFTSNILHHDQNSWLHWFLSLYSIINQTNSDANSATNPSLPHGTRTFGSLFCALEFDPLIPEEQGKQSLDGMKANSLAIYPGLKANITQSSSTTNASFRQGLNSDFTRENDFQLLLPKLSELDLNDPKNDHLLYLKSKRSNSTLHEEDVFRLFGLDFSLPFRSDLLPTTNNNYTNINNSGVSWMFWNFQQLKENLRIKLLKLRHQKPYLFQQPIPILDQQIKSNEQLKQLIQQEIYINNLSSSLPEDDDDKAIQINQGNKQSKNMLKVTNFLQRVRNSRTVLSRRIQKKLLLTSSVVLETNYEPNLNLSMQFLFERKRELKPKVRERIMETLSIDSCNLLVQVVGARNIPLRKFSLEEQSTFAPSRGSHRGLTSSPSRNTSENVIDAPRTQSNPDVNASPALSPSTKSPSLILNERKIHERKRVRSFVEVKFQENLIATATFEGATPMWRQSITLPFRPPQMDYTPLALEQLREDIFFTIFDEVIEDDSERGGFLEGETTVRTEKYYLGSFTIPFNTLYREGKIEGTFRIDSPILNFGYETLKPTTPSSREENNPSQGPQNSLINPITQEQEQLPTNRLVSGTNTAWALLELCGLMCIDCFPRFESSFNTMFSCIKYPFQPFSYDPGLLESLSHTVSYVPKETAAQLSYYISDIRTTYIKLLLTFDPILPIQDALVAAQNEYIALNTIVREDRNYGRYAQLWLEKLRGINEATQTRPYKLFASNQNGLQVLLSRYLTMQKPPPGFESFRGMLHLVSLIPFMKDAQSFIGEMDLWCSSEQFWEIGAGDEEEHAVMLHNYLRYLYYSDTNTNQTIDSMVNYPTKTTIQEEKVFLALGKAIPEGETVYVIVRDINRPFDLQNPIANYDASNYLVINPCTGHVYSAIDPYCPLKSIYTLATPYNIFANIQMESSPHAISFDILNPNNWRGFFSERFLPPIDGVNNIQGSINYQPTDLSYALEIERLVFQTIRNHLRRWRSKRHRSTTTFHPEVSSIMTDLLPKLEEWKRKGDQAHLTTRTTQVTFSPTTTNSENNNNNSSPILDTMHQELQNKLSSILRTRVLRGFPINIPFTDIDEIISKIKTFAIHEANHPEVQFVLAVKAIPIYNNVISLWIFIGTLEVLTPSLLN